MSPSSWGPALLFPSAHVRRRGWYQIGSTNLHRGPCRFFLGPAVANRDLNPQLADWRPLACYWPSDGCWGLDEFVWWRRSNTDMVECTLAIVDTVETNQFLIPVWLGDLEVFDVAQPWQLAKDSLAFRVWSYSKTHPRWHHDTKTNSSCLTSSSNTAEGRILSFLPE